MINKKKLILIGGGGHCKSVLDAAVQSNCFSEIVIADKNISAGSKILGYEIIGDDDTLPTLFSKGVGNAFISIGSIKNTNVRRNAYKRVTEIGFDFPTIIDPSAIVASSARIGKGVFIGKNAVINSDVDIGDMAIINTGAIIEHDCKIGEFTHIAVGATVCGGVEIASDVFVGANAIIVQEVKILFNSVIGAGSIVLSNVPENSHVIGVWE